MDAFRRDEMPDDEVRPTRPREQYRPNPTYQQPGDIMKLRTATIGYSHNDQIKPYCNHEAIVTLHFDVEEEDLENLPRLKACIAHAQKLAEAAVAESIARTRPAEPEPEPAFDEFQAPPEPARRWEPESLPPAPSARSTLPPPPPASAPPPPAASGNGQGKQYGPPKTARSFMGWLRNPSTDPAMADRAASLAKAWQKPWKFTEWSDDDIQYLYHTLTAVPAAVPPWGGNPADGNGNEAYGRR